MPSCSPETSLKAGFWQCPHFAGEDTEIRQTRGTVTHTHCTSCVGSMGPVSSGHCKMEVMAFPGRVVGKTQGGNDGKHLIEHTWPSPAPGRCSWEEHTLWTKPFLVGTGLGSCPPALLCRYPRAQVQLGDTWRAGLAIPVKYPGTQRDTGPSPGQDSESAGQVYLPPTPSPESTWGPG